MIIIKEVGKDVEKILKYNELKSRNYRARSVVKCSSMEHAIKSELEVYVAKLGCFKITAVF